MSESESTTSEQTEGASETEVETDDWAAAMAEQEASEPAETENEAATNEASAVQPAESEESNALGTEAASATVFKELTKDNVLTNTANDIDMILDIPVQLTVELGRTKLAIKNLLQLAQGSVVELDGMAGEPMDVLVNGCLIAQGEVVVVNDKFGIRLTDIITPSERIRKLNR